MVISKEELLSYTNLYKRKSSYIPTVSVRLSCYNQNDYIDQAISSILLQETSFDFELIICDDCSTDGTLEKIIGYQEEYQKIITVLASRENLGKYTGNGFYNSLRFFYHFEGKYVAILEGDDYWTDPNKLQKQVNYLEVNPDCSVCFHDRVIADHNGCVLTNSSLNKRTKLIKTKDDLLRWESYTPPTSTLMFRNFNKLNEWPRWIENACIRSKGAGDRFVLLMASQFGTFGYVGKIKPSVYRINEGGIFGRLNQTQIELKKIEFNQLVLLHEDMLESTKRRIYLMLANSYVKVCENMTELTIKEQLYAVIDLIKFIIEKPAFMLTLSKFWVK